MVHYDEYQERLWDAARKLEGLFSGVGPDRPTFSIQEASALHALARFWRRRVTPTVPELAAAARCSRVQVKSMIKVAREAGIVGYWYRGPKRTVVPTRKAAET